MTPREQAEELRQQAIKKLLDERDAIDAELKLLGYGQENTAPIKRRGRPRKVTIEPAQEENQAPIANGVPSSS